MPLLTKQKTALAMGSLCIAYLLVFFQRQGLAPIATTLSQELALSPSGAGMLGATFFYAYALAQIPSGLLVDMWGPKKAMASLFGLGAVGALLFALSTGLWQALLGRALLGIGMAVVISASFKAMSFMYTKEQYGAQVSLFMAIGGIGGFLASAPLAYLCTAISWRILFIALSVLSFALAAFMWKSLGLIPAEKLPQTQSKQAFWVPLKKLWSFKPYRLLVLWQVCISASAFSLASFWGGIYYPKLHGTSMGQTGTILSMSALALIFGAPLFTWLSEKVLYRRKPLMVLGSFCGLLAGISFFMMSSKQDTWVLLLQFLAVGIAANGTISLYFATVREVVSLDVIGISTGVNSLILFIGSGTLQLFIGVLLAYAESFLPGAEAFRWAFLPITVLYGIAMILSFFIPETLKKEV